MKELEIGSNPKLADSDSNGRSDQAEYLSTGKAFGSDYLDSDADGLSDSFEQQEGSNPQAKDSDFDGLTDAHEYSLGTSNQLQDTVSDVIFEGGEVLMCLSAPPECLTSWVGGSRGVNH